MKTKIITLLLIVQIFIAQAQMLLNPYNNWVSSSQTQFPIENNSGFQYSDYFPNYAINYFGEYQIRVDKLFNYWNEYRWSVIAPQIIGIQYMTCSFKIETV